MIRLDEQDQLISPGENWYTATTRRTVRNCGGSEKYSGFLSPRPVFGVGDFPVRVLQPELLAVDVTGAQPKIRRCKRNTHDAPPLLIGEELYIVSERGI